MFGNSLIRGLFLLVMFPKIISTGRAWLNGPDATQQPKDSDVEHTDNVPTSPGEFPASPGEEVPQEPVNMPHAGPDDEDDSGTGFDLLFVRWSLVVDSIVTALAGFSRQGWQVYAGK